MSVNLTDGARAVLALADPAAAPFESGTPAMGRAAYEAGRGALQGAQTEVASVRDVEIATRGGTIRGRLYLGIGAPTEGAPALLYLHGGGWVLGGLDSHDEICQLFAAHARAVMLCPD